MKPKHYIWNKIFRLLIAVTGIAWLVTKSFQVAPKLNEIDSILILGSFIAAQLVFPIGLASTEFPLIHLTVLGGGLIFGPVAAGWAALAGILAAFLTRKHLADVVKHIDQNRKFSFNFAAYLFGQVITPLILALFVFQIDSDLPSQNTIFVPNWQSSLAVALFYGLTHSLLLLADLGTYRRGQINLSRSDTLTISALEFVPLLFVVLIAHTYPAIGSGASILLGAVFLAISILINRNLLVHRDLDRRRRDLSTLDQISRTLRSTLEMEELLESIRSQVTNLLNVNNFYVALYDSEEEQICYPLAVKHGQRQDWPRRSLGDRLTDRVIKEGKPILLGHHAGETLTSIGLVAGEEAPFAWIGVPLITSQRTIGCLALFSLSEQISFTQKDVDLLTILSGQTSVAIENARLYEKVQQRALHLESLVHDLRSPISAVVSAIDVIEDSGKVPEEDDISKQALGIARRSAQRVLSMVESLMDIAKFQSKSLTLKFAPVKVRKLITEILEDFLMQANEFGIIIKNEVPADLPSVRADKEKIRRVIINLVDNALKYTPSGGQVSLSAKLNGEEMVKISVSDSGPGIPEEYRQKIFERFSQIPDQRGRQLGHGLGLSYCRLAVDAHGGTIWVEPNSGGGSVFNFTLPISEEYERE